MLQNVFGKQMKVFEQSRCCPPRRKTPLFEKWSSRNPRAATPLQTETPEGVAIELAWLRWHRLVMRKFRLKLMLDEQPGLGVRS